MSDWNKAIIKEFRANDGIVGGQFEGIGLILLNTVGAKSGLLRTNPVVYLADGDRYVVFASKGGAPTNPDWYYNILANPEFEVEVGDEKFRVEATVASEPERTQLYDKNTANNPGFAEYEKNADRVIPVVILTRQA